MIVPSKTIYVVGVSRDAFQFYVEGAHRLASLLGCEAPTVVAVDHPIAIEALKARLGGYDAKLSLPTLLDDEAVARAISEAAPIHGSPALVVANFDTSVAVASRAAIRLRHEFPEVNEPLLAADDKVDFRSRMTSEGFDRYQPRYVVVSSADELVGDAMPASRS